jgi:sugar phosphate isomerase/epimerase
VTTTDRVEPLYSVSALTVPDSSFAEELELVGRSTATGIGLWEGKFAELPDDEVEAALRGSGLRATLCLPQVWSILPNARFADPPEPAARIAAICRSVERLARFDPVAVMVTPGAQGELARPDAEAIMVEGLTEITRCAERAGVKIAVEPIRPSSDGFISSFAEALDYRDRIGSDSLAIAVDIWHLWDGPRFRELLAQRVDAIAGVQVNDWREPTRTRSDRVLPGAGVAGVAETIAVLLRAGYTGWYDLEVMSDRDLPDSLWALAPQELLRRADRCFAQVWQSARSIAGTDV